MWHNTSMLMDFGASKLLLMADIPPRTIAWDRHRGSKEVSLTSLLFLRELRWISNGAATMTYVMAHNVLIIAF
jgi:hypothetical protein